ncbi:CaiB/BaiF CoA transferase family protein [Xanthobacter flavus]|uniref:CaiB/BaiF CoA transferase family protein n=1 Tax=Xanthobacter flavus TaxID=281 RepID=UPI003727AFE2
MKPAMGSPFRRNQRRGNVQKEKQANAQAAVSDEGARAPQGLRGVRVLDLGRYIAAPFCTALLADQGAEVIRIEPTSGAPDREVMPVGVAGRGALYLQVNRNKKSLALDIDQPAGRAAFERLVATCDAVVVNLPPAALKRAGLDYESLRAIRPDIVLTTISAFGTQGESRDWIGFDGTGQALSGAMCLTGTGERPLRAAVSYVDYATGIAAAFATLAALHERMTTGRGQHVEASLLGTALAMTNPMLIEEALGARSRAAMGNRSPIAGPSDLFRTRDGWVMVQVIGDGMFRRWASFVGQPELIGDPRFSSDILRGENGEALSAVMAQWCAGQSSQECLARLAAAKIPACKALSPAEALAAPENRDGGFFAEVALPTGNAPVVTNLIRTAAGRLTQSSPAPELGADTEELLASLGYGADEIGHLTARRPTKANS